MQRAAVTGIDIGRYWSAGTAPILEILAEYDPFHPRTSGRNCAPSSDRE